jgi:hypothetical protein
MTQSELAGEVLKGNLEMLKSTVADFSDADMLARPCPAANHPIWQIGHLINSEMSMLKAVNAPSIPELPAGFSDRFKKETAGNDDPNFFPKKAELLDAFSKVRSATVQWVKGLSPADLEKPSPERVRNWAPTIGHLIAMIPSHTAMHVGQLQVARRKLGKPMLF